MAPPVTIAIPTFERFTYLREAVASALAQSGANIEVLIGDDGASKEIHEWSRAQAQADPRVRYQRNTRNLGLAGNWNALVDAARGEFILIIGDDDRLLPGCVETLVKLADAETAVAFANHFLIDSAGRRLEAESHALTRQYHRDALPAGRVAQPEICVWQNSVPVSAALVRTEWARRLHFREELNTPEIEFFLRVVQAGGQFVFSPGYLMEYRVHAQSATSQGLRSEALVRCLTPMNASPAAGPHKRRFMEPLVTNAISRCLERGDTAQAREFLGNPYRPLTAATRVQSLCASLPAGAALYRLLLKMKRSGK